MSAHPPKATPCPQELRDGELRVESSEGETAAITPIRFTLEEAQAAGDAWGFNCGPGALCAVLNLKPDELRPHLLDFEQKGYTNPTLMTEVLRGRGVPYTQTYRWDNPLELFRPWEFPRVKFGLVRIQWGGPWTKPGVPMRARYRATHWVAARDESKEIFDVNAMCEGGWLSFEEWSSQLVPWLIRECCPKGNGNWWPTHALEVERKLRDGELRVEGSEGEGKSGGEETAGHRTPNGQSLTGQSRGSA